MKSLSDGKPHRLELEKADGGWECRLGWRAEFHVDAVIPRRDVLSLLVDGHSYEIKREQTATDLHMWVGSTRFAVELRDPRSLRCAAESRRRRKRPEENPGSHARPRRPRAGRGEIRSRSRPGHRRGRSHENAKRNQVAKKGTVKKILATPGAAVNPGDVLAIVE